LSLLFHFLFVWTNSCLIFILRSIINIKIIMSAEFTNFGGANGAIKPVQTAKPTVGPRDVLIKITHSGVCATDLAYVEYGIALGHEGVGVVEAIGDEVTQFKVGDRAGGGYHRMLLIYTFEEGLEP
jgi:hypothetical protein